MLCIIIKNYQKNKEIIKEVVVSKIEKEYIYLQNEKSSNENEKNISKEYDENTVYKNKYTDKIETKVPIKIYIVLIGLVLTILFLTIKLISKKVD